MSAIYVVTGPRPIESPPSRVAEVPREPQQPLVVGHLRSSTRLVYTFEAFLTHALEVCTPTDPQPAECPTKSLAPRPSPPLPCTTRPSTRCPSLHSVPCPLCLPPDRRSRSTSSQRLCTDVGSPPSRSRPTSANGCTRGHCASSSGRSRRARCALLHDLPHPPTHPPIWSRARALMGAHPIRLQPRAPGW